MDIYYYKAGKAWDVTKLWEATKDNAQHDINVESFLNQDIYWNIGSFLELAKEIQSVLKADYSYPIILDEENKIVDGAHRLVHAYIDGKRSIKAVTYILINFQSLIMTKQKNAKEDKSMGTIISHIKKRENNLVFSFFCFIFATSKQTNKVLTLKK